MAQIITVLAAVPSVPPALTALGKLVDALKAPMGRKHVEALRGQMAEALEEVHAVLRAHEEARETMQARILLLESTLEELRERLSSLETQVATRPRPWWQRLFQP